MGGVSRLCQISATIKQIWNYNYNNYNHHLYQATHMIGLDNIYLDRATPNNQPKKTYDNASKLNQQRNAKQYSSKQLPLDIEKTLSISIKKANQLTDKINSQLAKLTKNNQGSFIDELRNIQQSIRRKNGTIKQLQNQVNSLKNGYAKPKFKTQTNDLSLTEEIQNYTVGIIQLRKQLLEKRRSIAHKQQQTKGLFHKYQKKCRAQQKQVVKFEQFKEHFQKRKKQFVKMDRNKISSFNNNIHPKKYTSILWQDRKYEGMQNQKNSLNRNQTLNQIMNRKNVAQTALKNERKKQKQQMQNWISKLEFLQGEDDQLDQKIRLKLVELTNAQKRFSESRNLEYQAQKPKRLQKHKIN